MWATVYTNVIPHLLDLRVGQIALLNRLLGGFPLRTVQSRQRFDGLCPRGRAGGADPYDAGRASELPGRLQGGAGIHGRSLSADVVRTLTWLI